VAMFLALHRRHEGRYGQGDRDNTQVVGRREGKASGGRRHRGDNKRRRGAPCCQVRRDGRRVDEQAAPQLRRRRGPSHPCAAHLSPVLADQARPRARPRGGAGFPTFSSHGDPRFTSRCPAETPKLKSLHAQLSMHCSRDCCGATQKSHCHAGIDRRGNDSIEKQT
jgi:hypothetical protein